MEYFLDMDEQYARLENSKYVLLPVAYDGTSTFIKGADKGPQAIIDASDSIELYDVQFEMEPYTAGIYTDKYGYDFSTPDAMVQSVYARVKHFIDKQKHIGILGGEHSVSVGSIKAFSEKYPDLSVLQVDAHADLRDDYHDSIYNHACVMRRAQDFARVVQVGIRNVCTEEMHNIVKENIFYAHKMYNNNDWMEQAINRLTDHVYLTIDLDGLDPSVLPSTGTPLPGGLSWYTLITFLEKLFASKKIVGFDVVELCPQPYDKSSDVLAAVLVYKIICLFELNKL
ncbi:MAG: agmatinase [Bacteroidales bacterium]|nr:agmatinase [Bacteroidales bacterium]